MQEVDVRAYWRYRICVLDAKKAKNEYIAAATVNNTKKLGALDLLAIERLWRTSYFKQLWRTSYELEREERQLEMLTRASRRKYARLVQDLYLNWKVDKGTVLYIFSFI